MYINYCREQKDYDVYNEMTEIKLLLLCLSKDVLTNRRGDAQLLKLSSSFIGISLEKQSDVIANLNWQSQTSSFVQ